VSSWARRLTELEGQASHDRFKTNFTAYRICTARDFALRNKGIVTSRPLILSTMNCFVSPTRWIDWVPDLD